MRKGRSPEIQKLPKFPSVSGLEEVILSPYFKLLVTCIWKLSTGGPSKTLQDLQGLPGMGSSDARKILDDNSYGIVLFMWLVAGIRA